MRLRRVRSLTLVAVAVAGSVMTGCGAREIIEPNPLDPTIFCDAGACAVDLEKRAACQASFTACILVEEEVECLAPAILICGSL